MIDEKNHPPAYMAPPQQQQQQHGQPSYAPPTQPPQAQQYPPQPYGSPPGPHPMQGQQQNSYFAPGNQGSGVGGVGGMSGYAPGQSPPMMTGMTPGQQYQQQLMDMCAAGNHDVTTKYGIAGIITAVVCFPCGLICLFMDTEKRCARCGVRVA